LTEEFQGCITKRESAQPQYSKFASFACGSSDT
jgi:hypothetical protein